MKANELTGYLKSKPPATVFVLTGTERLLKEECAEAIATHFEKQTGTPYETHRFHPQQSKNDSDKIVPAQLLDTLRATSLFGGRQLVFLHNGSHFYTSYKDSFNRYFVKPSSKNLLIVELSTFRPTKAITEAGRVAVVACDAPFDSAPPWKSDGPPYDTPLAAWTMVRARAVHGKAMTKPTAYALNQRTGRSLDTIDGELTKLALYLGDAKDIHEADIDALCGHDIRGSVFKAAERFFNQDLPGTLKMVRLLFERGFVDRGGAPVADPMAVCMIAIGTWRAELRKIWKVNHALARGEGKKAIMTQLKLRQDFQYTALATRARLWSDNRLAVLLERLVILDATLKTSAAPPEAAFEQFVLATLHSSRITGSQR